jgi:C1A family cysteine protease
MPEHSFGWVPSVPDFRDHLMTLPPEVIGSPLPPAVDLRDRMPPVGDQQTIGSCTAWASTAAWRAELLRQGRPDLDPSELAQYYWTRALEGTTRSDAGGTLRDAIKVLAKTGAAPEALWPYDVAKFAKAPPASVRRAARAHLALEYQAVRQAEASTRLALAGGYAVVLGISVYSSFERDDVMRTGVVPLPERTESLLGGHAICLVGYDIGSRRFTFRNSWGTSFGEAGYGTLPFEYVLNPKLASDLWIVKSVSA